jgi:CelD/BcsL family acetyltransferase involved in cellulose biosynthesis
MVELAQHHQLNLSGANSWTELTSRSMRSNVARQSRLLAGKGAEYRRCAPPGFQEWLATFRNLHTQRQLALGRDAAFGSDSAAFEFDHAIATLAREGHAELHGFHLGDRLLAGHISLRHGTVVTSFRIAFDAEYATYSPGTILLTHVIENAINTGAETFDFGFGHEDYKARWNVTTAPVYRFQAAPQSMRYFIGRVTRRFANK